MEAIDLTAFATTEDTVLEIMTPDSRPSGWKITLGSPSHSKAVAFSDKLARRNLHKAKLIEQSQINGKRYVADEKSPEEARRENIQWVVARIVDWTPVKIEDKTYPFSDENAEELLIRPELGFALVQITEALNDDRRFIKRSAKG